MKHCILCRKQIPEKPIFKLENAPASAQDIPDKEGKKKKEEKGERGAGGGSNLESPGLHIQ